MSVKKQSGIHLQKHVAFKFIQIESSGLLMSGEMLEVNHGYRPKLKISQEMQKMTV